MWMVVPSRVDTKPSSTSKLALSRSRRFRAQSKLMYVLSLISLLHYPPQNYEIIPEPPNNPEIIYGSPAITGRGSNSGA